MAQACVQNKPERVQNWTQVYLLPPRPRPLPRPRPPRPPRPPLPLPTAGWRNKKEQVNN